MEFEWSETKRQEVIERRKVDILYAAFIFEGPVFVSKDGRKEYGEDRWIAVGLVENECFVVVYTIRDGTIRLITAWKGGRHERRRYQERLARQPAGDAWAG
ncbi:BrnT family toxin [Afifella pfennigii]|uniref:BrnT family toxin n=1 Tax=Afifella pfennigii TaxID=209897 RepID=UPI0004797761|nr:BrnT family toxin [Afifella pfennigii]